MLREAREKGQVPRSRELNSMSLLMASAGGLLVLGSGMVKDLQELMRYGLVSAISAVLNYALYCLILFAAAKSLFAPQSSMVIIVATFAGSVFAAANTFLLSRQFAFHGAGQKAADQQLHASKAI